MDSLDCLNKKTIELLQKNNLLIPLITRELQVKELSNIEVPRELKVKALQDFVRNLNLPNQESFEAWKNNNNLTDLEIENLAFNDVKLKIYCKNNFDNKAESRFLERKSDLDIIVYSLLRVKEIDKARELYLRIEEKEAEFSYLASKFSEGIEKKSCGIIGPGPIGAAHPKLIRHLQNKPVGEVQPPIMIEDSYVIVRVESFDPAKLDNFMREKMTLELFNNWLQKKANKISENLLTKIKSENYVLQE